MVVEDREDPVDDGVVGLPESDVEREKGVNDCVDEEVELGLEEGPDELKFALGRIASVCVGGRSRQVGFDELLTSFGGQWSALLVHISSIGLNVPACNHY